MPTTKKTQNRHPVDRLAEVREQIKALQADEQFLKDQIKESGDTVGDEYIAAFKEVSRSTLDRGLLEVRYGKEAIAECCKSSAYTTLNIFKKSQP